MATFKYSARELATGNKVSGKVQASDEKSAVKLIASQGLSLLEISSKSATGGILGRWRTRISAKEKVIFARQLSTLVAAGLPILQSLRMVASQTTNKPFQSAINQIADEVEGGAPLSKSLAKHDDIFSLVFIGVVSAGEASGTLDTSLQRLAEQQEKDADIVSKVRGAAVYPAIVLIVMLGVITFMVVKVLPQVQNMYLGLPGAHMPLVTRFLLAIANFVIHAWWIVIFWTVVIGYFVRRWARTQNGISTIDRFKMRGPIIGQLFMRLYMARFARISSTLLGSGLPLLQVLQIVSGAIDNTHVSDSINTASEKVRGGKALSDSLTNDPNFLPLVPSMLRIGEQSGALETMMSKTADYYEKEVNEQVNTLSTTIEPVLMIMMGVMALVVVAAILLPIYGLVGQNINVL